METDDIKKVVLAGIKMTVIAIIVFTAVTFVPNKDISTYNRILISIVVTIIFAILDYIRGKISLVKESVCEIACDS